VLIVDDSYLIVKKLTEVLIESNSVSEVHYAYNIADAMMILHRQKPDIISLDINLSNESGIDLLRTIKKEYPEIIVAMLTNQASGYYKDLCIKLGADYFLDKSCDFDNFFDIISLHSQTCVMFLYFFLRHNM